MNNPPACPKCFHKAKETALENYETIKQWEAWYDENYDSQGGSLDRD